MEHNSSVYRGISMGEWDLFLKIIYVLVLAEYILILLIILYNFLTIVH